MPVEEWSSPWLFLYPESIAEICDLHYCLIKVTEVLMGTMMWVPDKDIAPLHLQSPLTSSYKGVFHPSFTFSKQWRPRQVPYVSLSGRRHIGTRSSLGVNGWKGTLKTEEPIQIRSTKVAPLSCMCFKLQRHCCEHTAKDVAETGPVNSRSPAIFLAASYYIDQGIVMLNNCITCAFLNTKHWNTESLQPHWDLIYKEVKCFFGFVMFCFVFLFKCSENHSIPDLDWNPSLTNTGCLAVSQQVGVVSWS